ncbi:MAG TPA: ABC transporter ATP-binding protein [Halanaerobiales bacterium]|nr:ABC transporter ATP-binding protein [Halanaerobiales bacterium]
MLKINSVTKVYENNKKAVDDLNLAVNKGEIFGFLGPNGAGKTTTIRMITGILDITEGDILVNGYSIAKETIKAKSSFTFVPDHPEIFDSISGIEYLNFIADMYEVPLEDRENIIEKYARDFEIYEDLTQQIKSYSHGMRQKLLVIGALLPNPKILILDEPLGGLDPRSARILKNIMREHCQEGGTVFFSSHVLEVVENLCDRVAIIDEGQLIACDTLKNLKQNTDISLEDIFLELTEDE